MQRYDVPLQENGRMILPLELRKALGLEKGDRVVIQAEGDTVRLTTARLARRQAQARFRRLVPEGQGVVDEYIEEKRAEVAREMADDTDRVGTDEEVA